MREVVLAADGSLLLIFPSPSASTTIAIIARRARRSSQRSGTKSGILSLFDSSFALFNSIHAAEHERRQITLHNLFIVRFFRAEPLPDKLSLSLLRGLLILRGDTRNCFVE